VTNREFARLLIEKVSDANIDKKIAVYANRLMLRLHSQPALMANLEDVSLFKPGIDTETTDQVEDGEFHEEPEEKENRPDVEVEQDPDSVVHLQLCFRRLPQEVISPLIRLIAAPREPKLTRYTKDGSARLGVEVVLKPSDFPGDEYEYSF